MRPRVAAQPPPRRRGQVELGCWSYWRALIVNRAKALACFAGPANHPAARALRNHVQMHWFLSLWRRSYERFCCNSRPSRKKAGQELCHTHHGSPAVVAPMWGYKRNVAEPPPMPPARVAKRSDGFVGFCWKRSRRLHYRLRRQRLESGVTGYVGRRTASESAQGAHESNKHDESFHFESPCFRCALLNGGGVPSLTEVVYGAVQTSLFSGPILAME